MVIFHSYGTVYQRVPSIFLWVFLWFSHFPMVFPWFSYGTILYGTSSINGALVRKIVELHGGFASHDETGAHFQ